MTRYLSNVQLGLRRAELVADLPGKAHLSDRRATERPWTRPSSTFWATVSTRQENLRERGKCGISQNFADDASIEARRPNAGKGTDQTSMLQQFGDASDGVLGSNRLVTAASVLYVQAPHP